MNLQEFASNGTMRMRTKLVLKTHSCVVDMIGLIFSSMIQASFRDTIVVSLGRTSSDVCNIFKCNISVSV